MHTRFNPGLFATVISHQRAANVPKMSTLVGPATWFVPRGQGQAYRDAGAPAVEEVDGALVQQRNAALRAAWQAGLPCLQMDDDLRKAQQAVPGPAKPVAVNISASHAAATMLERMRESGARLAGGPPTSNLFYYGGKPLRTDKFIIACMLVVEPCDLLFDERLRLKEDYDYTLQHLRAYGRVARCDDLLLTFAHYDNKGGCATYRTAAAEDEAIAVLREKWGEAIRPHPRRAHEIVLDVRKLSLPAPAGAS